MKIKRKHGFTLVEIMVVVIVLAILAAAVVPNIIGRREQAQVNVAQSDISNMVTMIEQFQLDMRRYPTEAESFTVLREPPSDNSTNGTWRGPYAKKPIPKDPWGHDYMYYSPAPNGLDQFGILSYGSDGAPGGVGDATDITSWENYNPNGTGEK